MNEFLGLFRVPWQRAFENINPTSQLQEFDHCCHVCFGKSSRSREALVCRRPFDPDFSQLFHVATKFVKEYLRNLLADGFVSSLLDLFQGHIGGEKDNIIKTWTGKIECNGNRHVVFVVRAFVVVL